MDKALGYGLIIYLIGLTVEYFYYVRDNEAGTFLGAMVALGGFAFTLSYWGKL